MEQIRVVKEFPRRKKMKTPQSALHEAKPVKDGTTVGNYRPAFLMFIG